MEQTWVHLRRWWDQMSKLEPEVRRLCHWRRWFRRIHEMVKANPSIDKGHPFYDWMFECYATSSSVAIRRLMDRDQRDKPFSLENLVRDISSNSGDITRSWFVDRYRYQNGQRGNADAIYDRFAGLGGENPQMENLPELHDARKAAKPIVCMVDKIIAHLDQKPPDQVAMLPDLDRAIDAVGDLFRVLHLFVCQRPKNDLEGADRSDWEWLFQQQWMLPVDQL